MPPGMVWTTQRHCAFWQAACMPWRRPWQTVWLKVMQGPASLLSISAILMLHLRCCNELNSFTCTAHQIIWSRIQMCCVAVSSWHLSAGRGGSASPGQPPFRSRREHALAREIRFWRAAWKRWRQRSVSSADSALSSVPLFHCATDVGNAVFPFCDLYV